VGLVVQRKRCGNLHQWIVLKAKLAVEQSTTVKRTRAAPPSP
jgi:hypothetical protein